MNENDEITLRLSNIYCQKTLAIAVREGGIDSQIQSDSIYMFEYVYIFSNILQKSILADISKVSLLKGELFWDFF